MLRGLPLDLEWDEQKRQDVIGKRGVDILEAALIFEGPVLTRIDDREDYGEVRLISLGLVDGEPYIVVHTERDGLTRLITAWKGGKRERDIYEARVLAGHPQDEGSG